MRLIPILLLFASLPTTAAALELSDAVRAAVERDPRARAAGVRLGEMAAAADAAAGVFDLVGDLQLGLSTERLTARDQDGAKLPLDTQRVTLDAALIQPLVWGTRLRAGWMNRFTDTDNPFRNCVPGVASEQCYESRLELSLTQPLLRGAGRAVNTLASTRVDAETRVAQAEQRVTVAKAVEQTVLTWAELAFAEADLRIRTRALGLAIAQRDSSARRVKGGRMAPVDLAVVEQAVAEREQAVFVARQRVAERRAELALRLGAAPDGEVALPTPAEWPEDVEATVSAALAAHPELAAADARIARQRVELVAAEDRTDAQLDLSLVAAQTGLDEDLGGAVAALPDNESSYYGLSLGFTFPFANRQAKGELAQARLGLQRADLERAGQARDLRLAVDAALRALRTAEQARRLAERVVQLAEISLEAEQKRLVLGRATQLDVLRVQHDAAEAALSVERARVDRLIAVTRLRRLTGRLLESYGLTLER